MSEILKELMTVAKPYDGEYSYCNYCEGSEKSLGEVLEDKLEELKNENEIDDYIITCESFEISSENEIGIVSIAWVNSWGLDGVTFNWEVC